MQFFHHQSCIESICVNLPMFIIADKQQALCSSFIINRVQRLFTSIFTCLLFQGHVVTLSEKRRESYESLSEETRAKIMHKEASQQESVALQRLAGREWHTTATEDEQEAQKSSGRNWHKDRATPEELAAVKRCGAEWHSHASAEELAYVKECGRDFHRYQHLMKHHIDDVHYFLAVQNSSIGDIVRPLLALTKLTIRAFTTLQSDPRDL